MARRKPRKGVLLLVVLSLLVLFALIGTAFIVVATQYQKAASAIARLDTTDDPPQKTLDAAVMQLLRGTKNPYSAAHDHELLRDLYGFDFLVGRITGVDGTVADGQFYKIRYQLPIPIARPNDYYNGCVFTIVRQGTVGAGKSVRVVESSSVDPITGADPGNPAVGYLLVESTPDDGSAFAPTIGDIFRINGRPLNGVGFGYDNRPIDASNPVSYTLDRGFEGVFPMVADPLPWALFPNHGAMKAFWELPGGGGGLGLPLAAGPDAPDAIGGVNFGGADEAYDVPDYQNMLLAMNTPGLQVIPSFHRPALINYWANRQDDSNSAFLWDNINIRRMAIMRPMPWDHPSFTGSNPTFDGNIWNVQQLTNNLITAGNFAVSDGAVSPPRLDVDNDYDGFYDSIWVDLGMPVKATKDGRLYKPLFAVLCDDMDGRLNINAHGNYNHLAPVEFANTDGFAADYLPNSRPRGSGFGPAEIDLSQSGILSGLDYTRLIAQRYGADGVPGLNSPGSTLQTVTDVSTYYDDPLSLCKSVGIPGQYEQQFFQYQFNTNIDGVGSSYASPVDMTGQDQIVLDHRGFPIYRRILEGPLPYETVNDPYEVNLVSRSTYDAPYSYDEIDQVLRYTDVLLERDLNSIAIEFDNRIFTAISNLDVLPAARQMITNASFSVPAPTMLPNASMREMLAAAGVTSPVTDIEQMARAKLLVGGVPAAAVDEQIRLMLPFEVRRGHRMDINRMFGDGRHNAVQEDTGLPVWQQDFYQVVDDPAESWAAVTWRNGHSFIPQTASIGYFQNHNQFPLEPNNLQKVTARQIFARNLFCLMLLSIENDYEPEFRENGLNDAEQRELFVRKIAQWVVNVIDYRDPDSIMTPFEYDRNPWNGWNVDGLMNTAENHPDRRVVWGMERPDLLLMESIAFHDRRVEDTDRDNGVGELRFDEVLMMIGDPTLDQVRIPEGSLFLELYCTGERFHNNPIAARELYNTVDGVHYLDLSRLAPPVTSGGPRYPVWRVAISESHGPETAISDDSPFKRLYPIGAEEPRPDSTSFQPIDMSYTADGPAEELEIERLIWFTGNNNGAKAALHSGTVNKNRVYYNRFTGPIQVAAGGYAVVGPRPATRIGWDSSDMPSQQAITLGANTFQHRTNTGVVQSSTPVGIIAAADAVATAPGAWDPTTDQIGISVSEPLVGAGYYTKPAQADGVYSQPLDEPLDHDGPLFDPGEPDARITKTFTYEDYRTAFLQRLANPLWPWNPRVGTTGHNTNLPVNPYITVDWIPIDLSVFNGQEDPNEKDDFAAALAGAGLPEEPYDIAEETLQLHDNIWTGGGAITDSTPIRNLVRFGTRHRGLPAAPPNGQRLWESYFDGQQEQATVGTNDFFPLNMTSSFGITNMVFGPTLTGPPAYVGDPALQPFAWITWNNRPFNNAMELLNVPATAPARLGVDFTLLNPSRDPYDADNPEDFFAPYGQMLNFFASGDDDDDDTPNLYAVLDAVEVPSRYTGTERFYNETEMVSNNIFEFRPPFHRFSRFRDPGRVNINTIYDNATWQTVMGQILAEDSPNDPADDGITFGEMAISRRGYSGSGLNPAVPTQFANPFRPSGLADMAPLPILRQAGAKATLLRPDPSDENRPLFASESTRQEQNTVRNPYFRYEPLQRIGSVATTQSNVYAVWITVGYFEVAKVPVTTQHPDGYTLGPEIGEDTGQIKRHRAFYMIDRSVPVGYEEGENHNVENAIMLRRFIE